MIDFCGSEQFMAIAEQVYNCDAAFLILALFSTWPSASSRRCEEMQRMLVSRIGSSDKLPWVSRTRRDLELYIP